MTSQRHVRQGVEVIRRDLLQASFLPGLLRVVRFRSAYWPGGTPGRIDVEFSVDAVVQNQTSCSAGYVCLLPITSTVFCVVLSISSRVPVKLHPVGATLKPWISVRGLPVKSVSALRSKETLLPATNWETARVFRILPWSSAILRVTEHSS